jgi:hypothetical protein
LTALWSASTDVFTALVSVGKSLFAALTTDVASFLIVVTCDGRELIPLLDTELGRFLTVLKLGSVRAVRRLAAATTRERDQRYGRDHPHRQAGKRTTCTIL